MTEFSSARKRKDRTVPSDVRTNMAASSNPFLSFAAKTLAGETFNFSKLAGKVSLFTNVASR